MKRRYPLSALKTLRQRKTDEQLRTLATELDKSDRARASVELAERAQQAERDEAQRIELEDRAELEQGALRAADLARAAEWRIGASVRAEGLNHRRAAAEEREREQLHVEASARAALGEAKAEERVVSDHEQRWTQAEQAKIQAAEEEDAADARAGRPPPRKGKP